MNTLSTLSAIVTLFAAQSTLAAPSVAKILWQCESQSDPDYATINLYSYDNEIYGVVSGEYGDGDNGIGDLLKLEVGQFGSRESYSFQGERSVKGLKVPGLKTRGMGDTTSLKLEFTPDKEDSARLSFEYKGSDMEDSLDCHKAVHQVSFDLNQGLTNKSVVADDGERLLIYMRNGDKLNPPHVSVTENLATCALTQLKDFGASQVFEIRLDQSQRDDGFNGCTILIRDRGTKASISFGYNITQ